MITCPCGQTVDDRTTSWPPYRTWTKDAKGEIIFAICVHGVVVLDKDKTNSFDWWNDSFL